MKKQFLSLLIFTLFSTLLAFGQNKVLLVNGESLDATTFKSETESVSVTVNSETKTIPKSEILCIIPAGKKGYTFSLKNNKKLKILGRDISNNYKGADKARIFAYKYHRSTANVGELYKLNSDSNLSEEEFRIIFNTMQRKIKSRGTTGLIISIVALAIVIPVFISTLSDAQAVSYNNIDDTDIKIPIIDLNRLPTDRTICLPLKVCA